jgi:hypothetical protein
MQEVVSGVSGETEVAGQNALRVALVGRLQKCVEESSMDKAINSLLT